MSVFIPLFLLTGCTEIFFKTKEEYNKVTDFTQLQEAWMTIEDGVSDKLNQKQLVQLEQLKIKFEEVLGISITKIKKVGNEVYLRLENGEELKLNLKEVLEPQIEKLISK